MKIHAIINFEAIEAKDTIVKAYLDEQQAESALEVMQSGDNDDEPCIYAGEVISFDVEPFTPQPLENTDQLDKVKGETVQDAVIGFLKERISVYTGIPKHDEADKIYTEGILNELGYLIERLPLPIRQHTATAIGDKDAELEDCKTKNVALVYNANCRLEENEQLRTTLADKDAEIERLKQLTTIKTGNKDLYDLLFSAFAKSKRKNFDGQKHADQIYMYVLDSINELHKWVDGKNAEIERLKAALSNINEMSDCGSYLDSMLRMKQIASKALTPTT